MVLIDNIKYACEACIKGHRSSSCAHTSRPLFEIKKKGRPVTQCEHCRQLRKVKQVHVKCKCEGGAAESSDKKNGRPKGMLNVSQTPAFPNGVDGVLASTRWSTSPTPPLKRKAESTCPCGSSEDCECASPVSKRRAPSSATSSGPAIPPSTASSCCNSKKVRPARSTAREPYPRDSLSPNSALTSQAFDYPAINFNVPSSAPESAWPPRVALSVCSCGITCTCPGCVEHSDPSTVLASPENCPYTCSTCNSCSGFSLESGSGFLPAQASTWGPLPAWTEPAPPAASAMTPTVSSCCGGSCKCTSTSAECQCEESCCGCCFGCECSDSDGDLDPVGGSRLGFAISGERKTCNPCNADVVGDGRKGKRRKVDHASGGRDKRDNTSADVSTPRAQLAYQAHTQISTLPDFTAPPSETDVERWPGGLGF